MAGLCDFENGADEIYCKMYKKHSWISLIQIAPGKTSFFKVRFGGMVISLHFRCFTLVDCNKEPLGKGLSNRVDCSVADRKHTNVDLLTLLMYD